MAKAKSRVQINNKRASFEYEFHEQYDAGIVLVGTEIKSLRAGKASLQDAYCYFNGGELYLRGMNIAICTTANTDEEARELLKLMGAPFMND